MTLALISILMLLLVLAGIAVRFMAKGNGPYAGSCSSNNPLFQNEGGVCGFCGARPGERCKA